MRLLASVRRPPSRRPRWAGRKPSALGTAPPADYKQLVETYGDGLFDGTIWLLVPDSAYDDCDLHAQTTEWDEILTDLWEAGARVLPWVFEEGTGAFLHWLARPGQSPTIGPRSTTRGAAPVGAPRHGVPRRPSTPDTPLV
ncbi:hypothetical protein SUDANB176_07281 [Streptomyces sp. enrichment culture]